MDCRRGIFLRSTRATLAASGVITRAIADVLVLQNKLGIVVADGAGRAVWLLGRAFVIRAAAASTASAASVVASAAGGVTSTASAARASTAARRSMLALTTTTASDNRDGDEDDKYKQIGEDDCRCGHHETSNGGEHKLGNP